MLKNVKHEKTDPSSKKRTLFMKINVQQKGKGIRNFRDTTFTSEFELTENQDLRLKK